MLCERSQRSSRDAHSSRFKPARSILRYASAPSLPAFKTNARRRPLDASCFLLRGDLRGRSTANAGGRDRGCRCSLRVQWSARAWGKGRRDGHQACCVGENLLVQPTGRGRGSSVTCGSACAESEGWLIGPALSLGGGEEVVDSRKSDERGVLCPLGRCSSIALGARTFFG